MVARVVDTRTPEECCQKHLELRTLARRGKRDRDPGDDEENGDGDAGDSSEEGEEIVQIGRKGTISRRRAVRQILAKHKKVCWAA
jgi:hypothetical protein